MKAFHAMLPRLQAEEQLSAISAHALGGGHMKSQDVSQALSRLERVASGSARRAPVNPALLAAMGIGVVQVAGEKSPENNHG